MYQPTVLSAPPSIYDEFFHPSLRDYSEPMDGELAYLQIVLPSDKAWRTHNYYKLVERQRNLPPARRHPMPAPWPETVAENEAKRPRVSDVPYRSHECRRSILSAGGLCWSSADLALAATLLQTPNARFPTITFSSLEEKRRVFTLVYDVLRYKSILNQALNDLYFFTRYPHLTEKCHLVWLLFFDLYKRDFSVRDTLEPKVERSFTELGLHVIDETLWQIRVKLAATVSRLRIKSGAHSLCQLLPKHLRLTRSALEENIITGWINIFKTNLKETTHNLEVLGITPLLRDREILEPLTFKTDHILPRFFHIMPSIREDLVDSPLIKDYHLIMQERTFCLGPAVIAQLLKDYTLSGKVAQTHVNSPITMAYFANLLINNDKIEALLVFGAGYRKEACERYLQDLGVKNTLVFSESFAGLPAESRVLDNVIAVLATPPNTNSSVVDPVDLAVARGGDLQILQQLTDDDFASTPRGENINKFLVDQRDTLRRAMSKPQIQFVVYETHSRFKCENEEMATTLVNELNNYATEVHMEELRRVQGETQDKERNQMETTESQAEVPAIRVEEELSLPTPPVVVVPPSDLFELADLPDLCPNYENCLDLADEGTYIAVIKRKEITRLDPKYMIQMAEARGLFGRPDGTPKAKNSGQTARAKAALAALQARSDAMSDKSKTKVKVELDRIAAPTRASILRDIHPPPSKDCPRHTHHLAHDGTPSYMRKRECCERSSFLTLQEEEELIRRLYTCPNINVFPTRLYEELPPLKFWNNPPSIIEEYLQRRMFQMRLQLAYEFNQTKEPHEENTGNLFEEIPNQLTKAIKQLTEDKQYFQSVNSYQIHREEEVADLEMAEKQEDSLNKSLWDRLYPDINYSWKDDMLLAYNKQPFTKNKVHKLLSDEIKKKYWNYKQFYRMKNIRNFDNTPVELNVNETNLSSDTDHLISKELPSTEEISISKYLNNQQQNHILNPLSDVSGVATATEENKSEKLPKLHSNSLASKFVCDIGFDNVCHSPNMLKTSENTGFNCRGTILTLRDSLLLAQEKLSRNSQCPKNISLINRNKNTSLIDSYQDIVLGNEEINNKRQRHTGSIKRRSTLLEHHDSVLLALNKFSSKEHYTSEDLPCDVCHDEDNKPIMFSCDLHSKFLNQQAIKTQNQSILSKSRSLVNHKDSLEIVWGTIGLKDKNQSFACQVEENDLDRKPTKNKLIKVSSRVNEHQKKENFNFRNINDSKKCSTKLSNYLLPSINIKQM